MGPIFETVRGTSYIDVTMRKGVDILDLQVEDDETLSGHKYLAVSVCVSR